MDFLHVTADGLTDLIRKREDRYVLKCAGDEARRAATDLRVWRRQERRAGLQLGDYSESCMGEKNAGLIQTELSHSGPCVQ